MRKKVFGRKFKRDANERKALLKGLINDLVLKESIKTTEEKAKAIKGQVEKLVTKAKNKGEAAHVLLQPYLSPKAIQKVLKDLAPRFSSRPGGYTRVIKLGERFGDNASMAIIEFVEKPEVGSSEVQKASKKTETTEKVEATAKVKEEAKKSTAKKSSKEETKKVEKKATKAKK